MGGWDWDGDATWSDPVRRREAENALALYDRAMELIREYLQHPEPRGRYVLTAETVLELHHIAMDGVIDGAGRYRQGDLLPLHKHQPPDWQEVPTLMDVFIDDTNARPTTTANDCIELAAFALWRINWIHPFGDGNGRVSRTVAYLLLSVGLELVLPGTRTIPELISDDPYPYRDALEAADAALIESGQFDVSVCADYLGDLLAKQIGGQIVTVDGAAVTVGGDLVSIGDPSSEEE